MNTPALSLLVLRAADIESTRGFYETLGLSFQLERHGSGPEHFSCDLSGVVLEIYPRQGESAADPGMIGLCIGSLDEALATLRAVGIEPKSGPRQSEWGDGQACSIPMGARCGSAKGDEPEQNPASALGSARAAGPEKPDASAWHRAFCSLRGPQVLEASRS